MYSALSHLMIGLPGTHIPDYLEGLAARGLKSVCIYGENVASNQQLEAYVRHLREILGPDCILAIDEEGGEVTRLDYLTGSQFAGNGFLGKLNLPHITAKDGRSIAERLARLGINLNLAPVADVNLEPSNPVIGIRSFGDDQELVATHVAAFVEAHESANVGTTLKHFPGHGNTLIDSHEGLPFVEGGLQELIETQLLPFEAGIAAGASAVMLGHLDLGLRDPSSLSAEVVELLRDQLGFQGLVITDAIDMGALGPRSELPRNAIRALLAGVDLVCLGPRTTLEELEKFSNLADSLVAESQLSLLESRQRLENFSKRKVVVNDSQSLPDYPRLQESPARDRRAKTVRFKSETNPAVGEVPWYSGVVVDHEAQTLAELRDIIARGPGGLNLMFRTATSAQNILSRLTPDERKKLLVIVPEEPVQNLDAETIITFGTAQPQSRLLEEFLNEGHVVNGK
jgi:beta-N-acetylhexosaminidase